MAYSIRNFTDNQNVSIIDRKGAFTTIEYNKDSSVTAMSAQMAYFSAAMGVRKRQVICDLKEADIITQAGAMQWMLGDVRPTTGIKGVGDLLGKAVKGKMSGESAIKPEYQGEGILVLEPTYKHIILEDIADWGGSVVLDDGLFMACEACLDQTIEARSNFSSAIAGGKGLFNLALVGEEGVFCLESNVPRSELIEIKLQNDVLKIDGNFAIAWSRSLKFTVERSGKTLIGSAASGEGLVNVYRGTGKVLLAPVNSRPLETMVGVGD